MQIHCDKCNKEYNVDASKIPDKGAKVTCTACGRQFIVYKTPEKKAPEPPKVKTPPCAICGAPSTHVLQGNPPKALCEQCFRVEKEKRQRFFEGPGAEHAPGDFIPEQTRPPASPSVMAGATQQAQPRGGPEFDDRTRVVRPADDRTMVARSKEVGDASQYFDSFDEVPDMDGADTYGAGDSAIKEFNWSQPESSSPGRPVAQPPDAAAKPLADPFTKKERAIVEKIRSSSKDMDLRGEKFTEHPRPAAAADESDSFDFQSDFSASSTDAEAKESDPLSDMDREVEQSMPAAQHAAAQHPAAQHPAAQHPAAQPPAAQHPAAQPPAAQPPAARITPALIDEMQIPITPPRGRQAAARSHLPAYLIIIGIVVVALSALGYYGYTFFSQGKSPGKEENIAVQIPKPAAQNTDQPLPQPADQNQPQNPPQAPPPDQSQAQSGPGKDDKAAEKIKARMVKVDSLFTLDTVAAYQSCIKELEAVRKLDPNNKEAYSRLVEVYAFYASLKHPGLNSEAEKMIEQAPAEVKDDPRLVRAQAHVLINKGDVEKAKGLLQEYLKKSPDDAVALYLMGVTYSKGKKQDLEKAVSFFQKALKQSPKMTRVFVDLGRLYLEHDQIDQALPWFQQALKLSPDKTDAQEALAKINQLKKKREEEVGQTIAVDKNAVEPTDAQKEEKNLYVTPGDVVTDDLKNVISEVETPMRRQDRLTRAQAAPESPARPTTEKPQERGSERPPGEAPR